ncbi:MAG: hypothetical protein ACXW52_25690, partial [Candidatus Binatia bacterium]
RTDHHDIRFKIPAIRSCLCHRSILPLYCEDLDSLITSPIKLQEQSLWKGISEKVKGKTG